MDLLADRFFNIFHLCCLITRDFPDFYGMSLQIASLNSGSNGNCYYVGNAEEAVLVDAGLSCREIETRMARLGLQLSRVKALFLSHEHSDHIKGVSVLSRKYGIPVYSTPATLRGGGIRLETHLKLTLEEEVPVALGALRVIPFRKFHDAADPFSFLVEGHGVRVGVFTDIGRVCEKLRYYFRQCHACFLETNYDEQMLENGGYPLHLKQRIRGGHGHLSNREALDLFVRHRPAFMSHLFLSHLSKNNNHPELALELFRAHGQELHISVASRYEESPVYTIDAGGVVLPELSTLLPAKPAVQLGLFE